MDSTPSFFYPQHLNSGGKLSIMSYYESDSNDLSSVQIKGRSYRRVSEELSTSEIRDILRADGLEDYAGFMTNGMVMQLGDGHAGRSAIMAIVNATPDSFFSDSRLSGHVPEKIIESGADIIDIGGESTRPGSREITGEIEIERLQDILPALRSQFNGPISLDTRHIRVVEKFSSLIDMVNDVSGLMDRNLACTAFENGLKYVLMHINGEVNNMTARENYSDLPGEMAEFYFKNLRILMNMGMKPENIIIDPGLGFSKNFEHDYYLVRNTNVFTLGFTRLVGHSRKRFLGAKTGSGIKDRLPETLAASLYLERKGIEILRVHDPGENIRFLEQFRFLSQQ